MISIITPFHKPNPVFLREAYQSILAQTYTDWQWVLVPNTEGLQLDLSEFSDPRVKIVHYKEDTRSIGKIKNFAFHQGDGDWLLELDWDDLLMPTALEELSKVPADYDFAYSNTAEFRQDTWESPMYDSIYGWQYREIEYNGHKLNEAISWEPNPQSISLIYYAPNHFRAWRKDFYIKIGGHNPNYEVCDDHELCIRTYLLGRMFHINKCLYLYRLTGAGQSWIDRNAEIQRITHDLYDQYIESLVARWCQLNNLRKIDLGGRFRNPPGWESVDLKDADIIADLNKKWPFEDNSIGAIRAVDFLEHLKDPYKTMKEIYRVLVPNGWLLSLTPSTDGRGAWQDPTHKSHWNENSFWYYTHAEQAQFIDNDKIRFQVSKLATYYPNEACKFHHIYYVAANLIKLTDKAERLPGLITI